ncbi:unnamed protein product [Brachionus calyciflorus]|uniref:GIY-YIG domain-containing protein n=1 Tax=Brachionus calyciflorus TaxID=104777 RepID=A0A814N8C5_9BILA|nr:unnamed protein product [Brachionus calyciflorus]
MVIPLKSNSHCMSTGAVYVIKCKKCNLFYIGETGKMVKQRILEHIYGIKYFKNNSIKCLIRYDSCSETAIHFAPADHEINRDFQFFIFKSGLIDSSIRKSTESELINLFLILNVPIINKKIPNHKYIKTLSFI